MRWKPHVRFGERARETGQRRRWHRALVRLHQPSSPARWVNVTDVEISPDRVTVQVRLRRRRLACPVCDFTTSARYDTRPTVPPATLQALTTLEWVHRTENLAVVGPSGTGKSHLLEALGNSAIDDGLVVSWFDIETLGQLVSRHRADDTVTKAVTAILLAQEALLAQPQPITPVDQG